MAKSEDGKKLKVTAFLIKNGYENIEEFLSFRDFRVVRVQDDGQEIGTLVYKGGFQSKPSWVSIFEGLPGFDSKTIFNQSSKAVYILKYESRWFCFTFGYGANTEPTYLKSIASTGGEYALLDRKEVMIGGGRSRVEFCDLYSKNNEIIHVKKYGGSSVLSHLFSQALVSGECFLHEAEFRVEVNKFLPHGFKLRNPKEQPSAKEYEVCMAIMSKEPGPLEVPFFSKVSLKYAVRTLRNLGYNVTKLKIER